MDSREVGIGGLLFDEDNEAKFASHRVTWAEVQQVFDGAPRFYRNRPDRRASIVMIGPTAQGRMLIVPLEELGDGACYPVTAFEPTPQQAGRYRRRTS